MSKKNTRKILRNINKTNKFRQLLPVLLVLFTMVSLIAIGYCLGRCWHQEEEKSVKTEISSKAKHHEPVKKVQKEVHPVSKKKVSKSIEPVKKKEPISNTRPKKPLPISKLAYRGKRPKLVIIIDDVHTLKQLHAIQHLPFPVTPSIFPPYSLSPHTEKLATQARHYMIHLPLESGNAKLNTQSKTLMRSFNSVQMLARMKELRRLFPRTHYINNHTGSRFTSDKKAVKKLYRAMKQEGFVLIDSRTSAKSKIGEVAHAFGDDYVARDIFLDNIKSVPAIDKQLKKAVRLAKKHGYAIAIGHPHKTTLKALSLAKPFLKDVEVVYIDKIFREE